MQVTYNILKVSTFVSFFLCFLTSCLTYSTPVGEWQNAPVILNSNQAPFEDLTIEVICGEGEWDKGRWEVSSSDMCQSTAEVLDHYGASIIGDYKPEEKEENEEDEVEVDQSNALQVADIADFKLIMIDRSAKRIFNPNLICYFTYTIYPCVYVNQHKLEVRFVDQNNAIMYAEDLLVEVTSMRGIGALPIFLTRLLNNSNEYRFKVRPRQFITHIANTVQAINYKFYTKQIETKKF